MTSTGGAPRDPRAGEPRDPSDIGEGVASWLEGLGLAAHLAEAGLPAFERDQHGVAVWTDPATGEPMTHEQLEALDQLLHAEGDDPAYAVPVSLVQAARQARLREELLTGSWFTYETLAELRNSSVDAARFMIHKTASLHRLLVVTHDGSVLVPAFQLTPEGEPRPELEPVLLPLLAAGMDPWKAWIWLTQPAALLGGLVPEEAAAEADTAGLVAHAAVRLAERVASSS
ncbi:MAG: hypothetical protein JWN68_1623 [Nocardioides sp.]|jgi:hypothetical protein|uniref:hypothetical protein n=1 Tax=Nocardioides sp. TaxID=35761 RepID=UPI00261E21AA|nr:hypothetical protein [Nocardioides sp.]MCW2833670.1 hypothetical protein [Nocardioides sp.]